ncbi:T9SS type A sorting domain-containing protein, partial [Rubrivirga sp. S365]
VVTGITGGTRQMTYTISDNRRIGAQLFKWLNDAANFTHTAFSPGQVRAVTGIDFPSNSLYNDGAFSLNNYNHHLVFDIIHGIARSEDVAYHEYGHFTMFRRNSYRPPNAGGQHFYGTLIDPGFAWTEGWPTAFAQAVLTDQTYNAGNFSFVPNVELAYDNRYGSFTQNNPGAHNEFRVSSTVNDFYDLNDDGDDDADRIYSLHEELEIIRMNNIDSIYEFYDAALASGYLTQLEKNRASRVMVQNGFPTPILPETAPFNAYISGPSALNQWQSGTWTASASGATGSYSYRWYKSGGDTGVTSRSYTTSGLSDFDLSVTVTSGGQTKSAFQYVSVGTNCDPSQILCPALLTAATPTEFALHAPAPNPSRGTVTVRYDLPEAASVRLAVYDLLGREVALLADGSVESGYHSAPFEAQGLPAGVYVVRIEAGSYAEVRRVTVVR